MISSPRQTPIRSLMALSARWFFKTRFILFQKRRLKQTVIEYILGEPIEVLPEVLNPRIFLTGAFFCRCLTEALIPEGSSVLDLGTGSGCCAVFAAKLGAQVTAVDINPEAVRCARLNATRHGLEQRIDVLRSDLFDSLIDRRFDVILFNPPFFPGHPEANADQSWYYGDVPGRFAQTLSDHLTHHGYVLLLLSSAGKCEVYLEALASRGYQIETVAYRDLWSEQFTLFKIRLIEEQHNA